MKVTIHIDGGARGNPGPGGSGVVIRNDEGDLVFEAGYYLGRVTNNQAEYTALIRALDVARTAGVEEVELHSDSELMVKQIHGDYRVKNEGLKPLYDEAVKKLSQIKKWQIRHVRREQNREADAVANAAMDASADVVRVNLLTI